MAVLDPCIMPASDKLGQTNEPLFDPDSDSAKLGIALRRVGWASYVAQSRDESDALIEIDLEAIRSRLLTQAIEAQAPEELLDCLRLSRVLPDPMRRLLTDRVRSTGSVLSTLLKNSPSRVYSKGVLRRHLVLAARLIDELDRARGLWSPRDRNSETTKTTETQVVVDSESTDTGKPMDASPPPEMQRTTADLEEIDDMDDEGTESKSQDKRDRITSIDEPAVTAAVAEQTSSSIDPGEDLVIAATMLSSVVSKNPLLNGLTDYLVDEGNAEEELLLSGGFQAISFMPGIAAPVGMGTVVPAADNTEMLQVLDRLILYLRIVHSVDFYAPALYVNEDAMPHPCLLLHLFANQLRRLIRLVRPLSATDCEKLGLRDVEEVVEAFVKANTRRKKRKTMIHLLRSTDDPLWIVHPTDVIWVCSLSDKKFRDPIYVKKHIMNKHMEKVEAVKKDTAFFFNNYLMDPLRPQLPLEPRLPSKRRRSRSRADSKSHGHVPNNEPVVSHMNDNLRGIPTRERSNTDQSGQRWYGERRFREDNNSRPFYPSNPFGRDHGLSGSLGPRPYGRMPYFQPRLPFNTQRGRYFGSGSNYQGMRHGFQRRPYVDLDAP
ncbi:unnamed protein product [Echinostoma caproni]|uniref:SERRATE/Ars2 C-terminal domain-containing protein n=1 Tax=Echinostoma caproni TaxID=27848 RepID=A0A3P8GGF2_9TREM|nr:unnamed protein product [Echinostoma caproni]